MYNHRKLGQEIAPYLTKKLYRRDIPNNEFTKRCSDNFYDVNIIRFYGEYVIISNLHYKITHKTKIENILNWKSLIEFWEIFHNYQKLTRIKNEL